MDKQDKALGCYKLRGLARAAGYTDKDIDRDIHLGATIDDGLGSKEPVLEQTTSVDVPSTALSSINPTRQDKRIEDLIERLDNMIKLLEIVGDKADKEDE